MRRKGKIVHKANRIKLSAKPKCMIRFTPTIFEWIFFTTAIKMPLMIIRRKKSIRMAKMGVSSAKYLKKIG